MSSIKQVLMPEGKKAKTVQLGLAALGFAISAYGSWKSGTKDIGKIAIAAIPYTLIGFGIGTGVAHFVVKSEDKKIGAPSTAAPAATTTTETK